MVWPASMGSAEVLIGEVRQMLRHERLARHRAHGREHQRIADAARRKMPRHHDGAVAGMPVGASGELGGGGRPLELNYWNGQSFGLDMNQQSYARCRAFQNASSWPGLSRPSTTSCQGRLDRSATGPEAQLSSQVTLTRTSTAAVPASIGTSLAESMRVAIGA